MKFLFTFFLFLLFFLILSPLSIILKIFKYDPLQLSKKSKNSYWISIPKVNLNKDFFKKQR